MASDSYLVLTQRSTRYWVSWLSPMVGLSIPSIAIRAITISLSNVFIQAIGSWM